MNDAAAGDGPRILVSYFFGDDTIPLGGSCVRALRALGCEVQAFDCRIEHPLQRRLFVPAGRLLRAVGARGADPSRWFGLDNEAVRQRALATAVECFDPDLLLVMRGNHYRPEFLAGLKARHGLRTAAWWLYGPEAHDQLVPELGWYDQYFSIYQRPVPGHRIIHLPALALDPELYRSDAARTPYSADIAFVGRHSPRRGQVLARLTDLPLSIWGPGWRRLKEGWRPALWRRVAGSGAWGDALLAIYRHSKIVLNVSVWDPGRESGLNLRIFDVPACGGFLLTDHSDELAEYFVAGRHIETWRDVDELRDKLRFYLANDAARERIAAAGHARAHTLPTYVDRMRELLGRVDLPGWRSPQWQAGGLIWERR